MASGARSAQEVKVMFPAMTPSATASAGAASMIASVVLAQNNGTPRSEAVAVTQRVTLPRDILETLGDGTRGRVAALAREGHGSGAIAAQLGLSLRHVNVTLGDGLVASLAARGVSEEAAEEVAEGSRLAVATQELLQEVDASAEQLAAALQKQTLASLGRDLHNGVLRPSDKLGLLGQVGKVRVALAAFGSRRDKAEAASGSGVGGAGTALGCNGTVVQNFLTIQMPAALMVAHGGAATSVAARGDSAPRTLVPAAPVMLKQILAGVNVGYADAEVPKEEKSNGDVYSNEGAAKRADFWDSLQLAER